MILRLKSGSSGLMRCGNFKRKTDGIFLNTNHKNSFLVIKAVFEYTKVKEALMKSFLPKIQKKEVSGMSPTQQALDYRREINDNEKQLREMVMESYQDIAAGKGRDCSEFFEELEKRYSNEKI